MCTLSELVSDRTAQRRLAVILLALFPLHWLVVLQMGYRF
jgi:hypothetical protein